MKIKDIAVLSILLVATSLVAADVEFTCVITGSGDSGFDILAVNPGPDAKKCTATCTVTRKDGSTKSWTYTATVTGKTPNQRVWFGGEAGVAGAPLSNPKISNTSCSGT